MIGLTNGHKNLLYCLVGDKVRLSCRYYQVQNIYSYFTKLQAYNGATNVLSLRISISQVTPNPSEYIYEFKDTSLIGTEQRTREIDT